MQLSYAVVWMWTKRVLRFYLYLTLIVWLVSAVLLFYLMHSHVAAASASSSGSAGHPALSGPQRVHAILHSSVDQLHSSSKQFIASTRALSSHLLDSIERTLSPSGWKQRPGGGGGGGGNGGVQRVRRVVNWLLEGADDFMSGLMDGVRSGIDDWLQQAEEVLEELRQQQAFLSTQTLPWQQQQLHIQPDNAQQATQQQPHGAAASSEQQSNREPTGKTAAGQAASSAAAAGSQRSSSRSPTSPPSSSSSSAASIHPSLPTSGVSVLSSTPALTTLRKSPLPDGSVLYLSPAASSSDDFSLTVVAQDEGGTEGERRVLMSSKDGLLRVTWKGWKQQADTTA